MVALASRWVKGFAFNLGKNPKSPFCETGFRMDWIRDFLDRDRPKWRCRPIAVRSSDPGDGLSAWTKPQTTVPAVGAEGTLQVPEGKERNEGNEQDNSDKCSRWDRLSASASYSNRARQLTSFRCRSTPTVRGKTRVGHPGPKSAPDHVCLQFHERIALPAKSGVALPRGGSGRFRGETLKIESLQVSGRLRAVCLAAG